MVCRITEVFGHAARAGADFQHIIVLGDFAGRHQRGEKILVINKVLPQALLVAEIAVVNAFLGLAHAMLLPDG